MTRRDSTRFLTRLRRLDAALVESGMPAIHPRWWQTIETFERSGRRRAVVRKGRRVGASTIVAPRLAVGEMLFGGHVHTPGTPPLVFAFLSVRRGEAAKRLHGVRAILDALGEPYHPVDGGIALANHPAVFQVVTANYRTNVGDTVAFAWLDEVARWIDTDSSTNPAKEVVASLAPALATLPDARMWLVSSPLGQIDFHARSFEDERNFRDQFATWMATPLLTESDCRAMEPDPVTFDREYAAIPSEDITEQWFGDAVDIAVDRGRSGPGRIRYDVHHEIGIDQAFQHDRFGYAVVSSTVGPWDALLKERTQPRLTTVHETGAWKPDRSPREMARRLLREVCRKYETDRAVADQYSGLAFQELARDVGLKIEIIPWTAGGDQSKLERFKSVRLAMYEGTFRIPDDPSLIAELKSVRGTILPSGGERIEVPRTSSGHGDRVSALVLAGSVALSKPPQLPESMLTDWERRERENTELPFGGGLFHPADTVEDILHRFHEHVLSGGSRDDFS